MASTKKLRKAASAAFDTALDAVAEARKAAKGVTKADSPKKAKKARRALDDALDRARSAVVDAERASGRALTKATRAKEARRTASAPVAGADAPVAPLTAASAAPSSPTAPSPTAPSPTKSSTQVESEVAQKSVAPASTRSATDLAYTPPLPHVDETTVTDADGHDEHLDLHAQTLVSLRAHARTKGITGISRLTKAELIEALQRP